MSTRFRLLILFILLFGVSLCFGQDYKLNTLFNGHYASGGYGAITNKFTTLNGQYANMVEIYGGWYVNHKFLFGIGGSAVTNSIQVPAQYRILPDAEMIYTYGQFGSVIEYTLWSHRAIHLSFHAMNGAGFTAQYWENNWNDEDVQWGEYVNYSHDTNWFFVTEPGIKIEMNVLRWMRFSPGISYRAVFGDHHPEGLSDSSLSGTSVNLTLKFGKF
jgi:hypothetical protein